MKSQDVVLSVCYSIVRQREAKAMLSVTVRLSPCTEGPLWGCGEGVWACRE